MKSKISYFFLQFTSRRGVKPNKKLVIFLFFLCLSCFLWFLNALKNEYTTEISYPVEYSNHPTNKVLIKKLPSEFKLKVKSHGYTLFRNLFNKSINPIVIDIDALYRKQKNNKFYILSSETEHQITRQLLNDIHLIDIIPDTLYFEYSNMISKKVPVKPNLHIKYQKQYFQSGKVLLKPDSITVSGAKSILDTLKYVKTEALNYEDLQTTVFTNVELFKHNDLVFSENEVLITLPVEKFTEASFIIPIEVKNKPKNEQILTYPNEVRINFLVSIFIGYHFE